jgi:hypothetical protein
VSGEYLVSAKVTIFLVSAALFALVYLAARRRGAPRTLAVAIVAAIVASSAATSVTLGIRWDSLATLLQLGSLMVIDERVSTRRALLAGLLCALAIMAKFSALWAPAAVVVWLAWRSRRELVPFLGALVGSLLVLTGVFEAASDGRFLHNIRTFAFAGSQHAHALDGAHRLYQLAVRNERSLPLFLAAGFVALVVALARRRIELYELALVFLVPILLVVMRDQGAYENHLVDLEVLAGLVLAGAWRTIGEDRRGTAAKLAIAACIVLAIPLAARYTLTSDARAALSHGVLGADARYTTKPFPGLTSDGTCTLFEDASVPILAGQRPVVLDAFIVHRLQTVDRRSLDLLVRRVDDGTFRAIVLNFPLSNLGWFATLDFGTKLADSVKAHYRLATVVGNFYVYRPLRAPASRPSCVRPSLRSWN